MIFLLHLKFKTILSGPSQKKVFLLYASRKVMIIQSSLLTPQNLIKKTIHIDNIKATFTGIKENFYDIILEINSNKFLINMESIADTIEQFEIIAVKGFIELSNRIVDIIKKLVEHLRYRLA